MIFTDYYKGQKLTDAKNRYDIIQSAGNYEYLENVLINKRGFNVGGLSFNYVERPKFFNAEAERKAEMVITKGSTNISSVFVPELQNNHIAYGDIKGTQDAIIFLFSDNYNVIEMFIARGYKNDIMALYEDIKAGSLNDEMEALRTMAKDVLKE